MFFFRIQYLDYFLSWSLNDDLFRFCFAVSVYVQVLCILVVLLNSAVLVMFPTAYITSVVFDTVGENK